MTTVQDGGLQPPELEKGIQYCIAQRTQVRLQTLEVEVIGNRVVIRGCVPSYYMKLLVLQGILDVVGCAGAKRIELDVQVTCVNPQADVGAG
jgi:hypothetical protein